MELDLLARTSAILLAACGNHRGPSCRGTFHAPPRLASRDRHRAARADTWTARFQSSNCSKRSRGSKGGVLNCGFNGSVHGTVQNNALGTLGTIGTLGTWPVLGWFLFCWLLSGVSVWRGSKAAPMEWCSEAEKLCPPDGHQEPGRSPPIAPRRQSARRRPLHVNRDAAAVGGGLERRIAAVRARPRVDAHSPRRSPHAGHRAVVRAPIYWFNPLVWYASAALARERERACDDEVLRLGAKPSAYASLLLDLARSQSTWTPATALSMARPSAIEGRLLAILGDSARTPRGSTRWIVTAMLADGGHGDSRRATARRRHRRPWRSRKRPSSWMRAPSRHPRRSPARWSRR